MGYVLVVNTKLNMQPRFKTRIGIHPHLKSYMHLLFLSERHRAPFILNHNSFILNFIRSSFVFQLHHFLKYKLWALRMCFGFLFCCQLLLLFSFQNPQCSKPKTKRVKKKTQIKQNKVVPIFVLTTIGLLA